jgi:hypothetical protein
MLSREHEDGCAIWQPQGVGSEAYLNGTSLGPTPEDARKDGHIIRARCAPLSPASGFPVSSRSLRSAQSRKRVPSFVVAANDSWNIGVKPQIADRVRSLPPNYCKKHLTTIQLTEHSGILTKYL